MIVVYCLPMDFDRLRYLVAVARTGSVRGAANALSVTPGAVSKGLARLEQESGVQLLRPAGRGVELTDEGRWLADRADYLVGEYASISSDLASRSGRAASLCVATHDVFATWFPALLTTRYLTDIPLSVRERWPGEVEQAVATRLSDVGITFIPVPTEGIEHVEVATVPMGVFTRTGAFSGQATTSLPYAVASHPVSGSVGRYGPLDGWPADGPTRTIALSTSSLEARLELTRQGACAIVIPQFVAEQHNKRVAQSQRLELRDSKAVSKRWTRRVYVARRVGASPELARRTEIVATAAAAFCSA